MTPSSKPNESEFFNSLLGGWPLAATVAGLFVILVWIVMIGWLGLRLLLWLFGE